MSPAFPLNDVVFGRGTCSPDQFEQLLAFTRSQPTIDLM